MSSERIVGGVVSRQIGSGVVTNPLGADCYQATAIHSRQTEVAATTGEPVDVDDEAGEALFWARVAAAPHAYQHVTPRPRRPQGGVKLYQWVAGVMGVSTERAESLINQAEAALIEESRVSGN